MATNQTKQKQKQKQVRKEGKQSGRNWTIEEVGIFAEVLSDVDLNFAATLEKKALKRSSSKAVYLDLQKEFFVRLEDIKQPNQEDDLETLVDAPINTDVTSLQKKYNYLKGEWRKISDRAKLGSGLSPEKGQKWYLLLNPSWSDGNAELGDVATDPLDTSYGREDEFRVNDSMVDGDESDGEHEAEAESANAIPKGKLVAKPHEKRKCVRSQTQALSQVASSIGVFTESQNKRQKLQMEEEKKRDELFLKFKMDEAEKNRQHELQMTRMMMGFMSGRMSNNTPGSFQCPSSSLPPSYPSWPNFQMINMVSPARSTLHTPDALTTLRQSSTSPGYMPYNSESTENQSGW